MALAPLAWGAGATAWEMNSYQDFIRGRFEGLSLTRDGQLKVAPKIDTLFASDQPIVWSMARGREGAVYAATGHKGHLYEIDKSGKSRLLWTAEQPEIFAITTDAAGVLYAGTSPHGKVYRIAQGKASEYFAPDATYIWSLAVGPDGALYVGTGDQGKIFRVTAAGKGEVYYETGQSHVTSLALDREGRLLAGSEPNGILYRVTAKDKAFVLYDANLPEIHSIVAAPDGMIYAAALGGSVARLAQGALKAAQGAGAAAATPTAVTTITVTAESAQAGADVKPQTPQDPAAAKAVQPAAVTAAPATPVLDLTGVEKSALYRINPDNTVETLWSSKEENIYDLLAPAGQILFSTDGNGRIYRLTPDRKVTLVTQTNESEATRLLAQGGEVLAATGNLGKIYRLGDQPGSSGTYESPVHDAGGVARWGRINWRAEGSGLEFRTRSGNSLRPDKTWSDWSDPVAAPGSVQSPNARFIQWKAELRGDSTLDDVTLAYIPQNMPPVVKSINVFTVAAPAASYSKSSSQSSPTAAYSITVTDTGDASAGPSAGTPTQALSRAAAQQINITWQADDPDGDRLVYALYFRGADEHEWKLLKANLHENTFTIDGDSLADGRYFFRVTASDREANPPASAREAELVSVPVLIDNTPPLVNVSAPRRKGSLVELDVEAADAASPLRRCEYSIDAGPWTPLEAVDGVIDSPQESFQVRLRDVPVGEHVIVIRAIDSAGNAGLAKVVIR
jgi:sugar lactone lactonase YvrE